MPARVPHDVRRVPSAFPLEGTGELLENALKYGNWTSGDRAMFRLRVLGTGGNIEVSVQNPLKPDDQSAQALMAAIEWINSYPKPEAAYRCRSRKKKTSTPSVVA